MFTVMFPGPLLLHRLFSDYGLQEESREKSPLLAFSDPLSSQKQLTNKRSERPSRTELWVCASLSLNLLPSRVLCTPHGSPRPTGLSRPCH